MFPVYAFIAEYAGQALGLRTEIVDRELFGTSFAAFDAFERGAADVGFICGLPYVLLAGRPMPPVELLAAPVLQGERYGGRPVYFADVIVHRASPFHAFADLRGCRWSYNDTGSHSGYGLTRYELVRRGETNGFFGCVVEAGHHQKSIQMVAGGAVDAAAIDSHVLALALRDVPALAGELRVIDVFGPSSIQPVVAASRLPESLKSALRQVLLAMAGDPIARDVLAGGLIERFVPVVGADYDDIRQMLAAAEHADFMTIR
jgi:phosphonate transport system substrate-binding protein